MSRPPRGFCAGAAFQNRLISCAGLSTWGFKFDVGGLGVASFLGNVADGLFGMAMCWPRQNRPPSAPSAPVSSGLSATLVAEQVVGNLPAPEPGR